MCRAAWLRAALVAFALLASAFPAASHSPLPGVEGFYTGLIHPLTSADQILAVLGVGCALGGFALSRLAPALGALFLGLLGGVIAGLIAGQDWGDPAPWLLVVGFLAALAAALAPGRGLVPVTALTLAVGLLVGWASIPEAGPAQDRAFTMSGSIAGAFLSVLYLVGAIEFVRGRAKHPAIAIGLRVVAAWICAVAVLMLALRLAPSGP